MLNRALRWLVFTLLRLFYPKVEIQGGDLLPSAGPVIFVANHPNGLLDPLLLMSQVDRPVRFLTASYLFRYPVIGQCLRAFGALPVFRERDRKESGEARIDVAARNEETFARCRAWLKDGGALALFPEGTTHSGATLLRLRSGASRIALSAESETGWQLGLRIVPVGLWYQNKTVFRSTVLLVIGEPFTLSSYASSYAERPQRTVQAVTRQLQQSLDRVVLQAENSELLAAMPVIADWTSSAGPPVSLAQRRARAGQLLAAYTRLAQENPGELEVLARQARRYARTLRLLGIDDPWALELPLERRPELARRSGILLLTAPFALPGFILCYGPYRLTAIVTARLAGHDDTQVGHSKLMIGSGLQLLSWISVATMVGVRRGIRKGALLFLLQPLLGYIALRWGENWRHIREAGQYLWLRGRHRQLTQQLIDRRRELAAMINEQLSVSNE